MSEKVWAQCLADMKAELPGSEFNTWILPLQLVKENSDRFEIDLQLSDANHFYAAKLQIAIEKFTLIGATTRLGLLSRPLRDRFGIPLQPALCQHLLHAARRVLRHRHQRVHAGAEAGGCEDGLRVAHESFR